MSYGEGDSGSSSSISTAISPWLNLISPGSSCIVISGVMSSSSAILSLALLEEEQLFFTMTSAFYASAAFRQLFKAGLWQQMIRDRVPRIDWGSKKPLLFSDESTAYLGSYAVFFTGGP